MAPLGDVSRRLFLKCGACFLALSPIRARAQSASSRTSPPEREAAPTAAPIAAPIAAPSDEAKHLRVPVRIDGKGPYQFVVDTGADRSVLAADVADELELSHGARVMMEGVVRAVAAETVTLNVLSFGPVECRHLVVPVLPRSMLDADGYLGLDALDGHRVIFDFKNHTLEVSEPRSRLSASWVRQNEVRVRTSGPSGHLRAVDCDVDGVAATAFIDTGAEVSAGNASLFAALTNRRPTRYEADAIPLTDVTGGETLGRVTLVKKIRLMDVEFTDCSLVISDFQVFDVWGLRQRPALLIGMNFLRQFSKVSIDYGRKEIRFDLARLA